MIQEKARPRGSLSTGFLRSWFSLYPITRHYPPFEIDNGRSPVPPLTLPCKGSQLRRSIAYTLQLTMVGLLTGRIDCDQPDNHIQQEAPTHSALDVPGQSPARLNSLWKPIQGLLPLGCTFYSPVHLVPPFGWLSSPISCHCSNRSAANELPLIGLLAKQLNFILKPPTCQVHSWIYSRPFR